MAKAGRTEGAFPFLRGDADRLRNVFESTEEGNIKDGRCTIGTRNTDLLVGIWHRHTCGPGSVTAFSVTRFIILQWEWLSKMRIEDYLLAWFHFISLYFKYDMSVWFVEYKTYMCFCFNLLRISSWHLLQRRARNSGRPWPMTSGHLPKERCGPSKELNINFAIHFKMSRLSKSLYDNMMV